MTADRRADYARMLADSGQLHDAVEVMVQALEIVPDWAAGWFLLSRFSEKAGDRAGTVAALRRVVALDLSGVFGAGLKLASLGEEPVPDRPPSAYVEGLFDDFASHFDRDLVDRLGYRVPIRLADIARAHHPERFACVVDLGCGTGLFGTEIRPDADRLEGYDLSANMLALAEGKGIYDQLARADLSSEADEAGLFSPASGDGRADLVAAVDVMIYLGRLERIFALAARLLRPGGLFAFSVEASETKEGVVLLPSLRYAHSRVYVEACCVTAGLVMQAVEASPIRMDAGRPIDGLLCLAIRI